MAGGRMCRCPCVLYWWMAAGAWLQRRCSIWWRRVLVRGPSMSPTLRDGDVLLVAFGAHPRSGDVVLVCWPARRDQLSVKRAVAPVGDAWDVRGDNPYGSTDSVQLGPARVLGVVRWRLWPYPGRPSRPRMPDAPGLE